MGILSLVSRLALKQGLSPPTPRSKGLWGCFCSPAAGRTPSQYSQEAFPGKQHPWNCSAAREQDSFATTPSQIKGAREQLERRGAVLLPRIGMAHCSPKQTSLSSKGLEGSPKGFPLKMHLSPRMPHPQQIQPKTTGRSQPSGMFFSLRTPDPQCNRKSDLLRHRLAPFSLSCFYEASKKPGWALDNFLKAWCHL